MNGNEIIDNDVVIKMEVHEDIDGYAIAQNNAVYDGNYSFILIMIDQL